MVGPEKNDGFFVEPVVFKLLDQIPRPVVHGGNEFVVTFPVFAGGGSLGVVRWKGGEGCRILALSGREGGGDLGVFLVAGDAAFMGSGEIEHGEERLRGVGAIAPMALIAGLIPDAFEGGFIFGELVIRLTVVGRVITGLTEVGGEEFNLSRESSGTAHVLRADGRLIHAGDDRAPYGSANACGGVGVIEDDALAGELIEMRCDGMRVAHEPDVRTDVFGAQPQNIGTIDVRAGGDGEGTEQEDEGKQVSGHGN